MIMEKIAIESTEDFEDMEFKQDISMTKDIVNQDGTVGMINNYYRIVHIKDGVLRPIQDDIFTNKNDAEEYARLLDDKKLVSYEEILDQTDKRIAVNTMVEEIKNQYDAKKLSGGETPPENAEEKQQFNHQKFAKAVAHSIVEANCLENAAKAVSELRWTYSEFLDEELQDVLENIGYRISTLQSSMQWVSDKMIEKATNTLQQDQEKQLKTLVDDDLVNHETEKAYFIKIPKAVMKSDMDGLWVPKKIMKWNAEANAYEVNHYQKFQFTEYQYSKENGKLGNIIDKKVINGAEFKNLMLDASMYMDHLRNLEESPSIVPNQSVMEENTEEERKGRKL